MTRTLTLEGASHQWLTVDLSGYLERSQILFDKKYLMANMLSDPLVKFSGAGVNMRNTFFEMVSAGEPIYCDLKLLKNLNNLCI